jgi:hypothetical protein
MSENVKIDNVNSINEPTIVKSEVQVPYYNEAVEENSIHVVKIFLLCVFIILLLYNLYQYLIGEETLVEKLIKLITGEKKEEKKPKPAKPTPSGVELKKNNKKKKNDEINMDVTELALLDKLKKIPQSKLDKALEVQDSDKIENQTIPSPDLSSESDIQTVKKTGYCFIGSEGGKRYCVDVKTQDKCMSGDIYPSMDLCIHPNLRK